MCGFAGYVTRAAEAIAPMEIVGRMASVLRHRGPDDEGAWADESAGVALGFRRLSIVDLSLAGHQPMLSRSGRYVIAFNGEVYNHDRLREILRHEATIEFRGHSDTEVMLEAIERWGVRRAVEQFIGMFAFGLWDREERSLCLVRDRFGVKPLYYGIVGETLLFGSELKALKAHPRFDARIDRGSVALLMRYNYIPGPRTIYEGISKLRPGTILKFKSGGAGFASSEEIYWSAENVARKGLSDPFTGSDDAACDQVEALLGDAIQLRRVADVPLGVFLSGGIDSSVVAAIMQAQSPVPVRTFSIGFHEQGFDEAGHARRVADHLRTAHTELYVTSREALDVVPKLPQLFDEPFADSSQIPTYLVSAMARRHVTVCLSGDGGDELFGGYTRYLQGQRLESRLRRIPSFTRPIAARIAAFARRISSGSAAGQAGYALWRRIPGGNPASRLEKLPQVLSAETFTDVYRQVITHWPDPAEVVVGSFPAEDDPLAEFAGIDLDPLSTMMLIDAVNYLCDDILVKVDRASMGVSLEAREPLLDHRLFEFAWTLPQSMKIRDGKGKWILRKVLSRHVPVELFERPKMGFAVPIDSWLRGPLKEWADNLLSEQRLREEGFFHVDVVRQKWTEHRSGARDWHYYLWDILMFQAWLEDQKAAPTRSAADLPSPKGEVIRW